jgi:proteasome lid subunit RPN8/RPN11
MSLHLPTDIEAQIRAHGEAGYPHEGAGFLLGRIDGEQRNVISILPVENAREEAARHNRYLLGPEQMLNAENTAQRLGLDVLGVFHSHPDHPAEPSEFDREWALPFFSYIIVSINQAKASETRSWRLVEDRSAFIEEPIIIMES